MSLIQIPITRQNVLDRAKDFCTVVSSRRHIIIITRPLANTQRTACQTLKITIISDGTEILPYKTPIQVSQMYLNSVIFSSKCIRIARLKQQKFQSTSILKQDTTNYKQLYVFPALVGLPASSRKKIFKFELHKQNLKYLLGEHDYANPTSTINKFAQHQIVAV